MKYKILTICDDDYEAKAVINALKNQLKLDELYQEVFRNKIKHGNDLDADYYEKVWEEVKEYLWD